MHYKGLYERKFEQHHATCRIIGQEEDIRLEMDGLSQARMRTLCDELVHDGYAESGQVTDEGILLGNPDPWMCGEDDLKSMISSVMGGVNFEITFLS